MNSLLALHIKHNDSNNHAWFQIRIFNHSAILSLSITSIHKKPQREQNLNKKEKHKQIN